MTFPLENTVYLLQPCVIGKRAYGEESIGDIAYVEDPQQAIRLEDRNAVFCFSSIAAWVGYAQAVADEAKENGEEFDDPELLQFINRFRNPPLDMKRLPEWHIKMKELFGTDEPSGDFWHPDNTYLHEDPTDETPAS